MTSPVARLTGRLIDGRYRLDRKIGAGGMGEVWRARQESLERDVAIKIIRADAGTEESLRFRREARAISKVTHENVVSVFDTGADGDIAYIAMELLEGETLRARMRRGHIDVADALSFMRQILQALGAAHAAGIIHRDVKPENAILVGGHLKLVDFGIARSENIGDTVTTTGLFIGTPAYAAPEVLLGTRPADAHSDVYSAGVIFWELLAGRRLFDGANAAAVVVKKVNEEPPRLPGSPLGDVVAAMLARDPLRRPPVAELLDRLSSSSKSPSPSSSRTPPSSSLLSSSSPHAPWSGVVDALAAAPTLASPAPTPLVAGRRVVLDSPWFRGEADDVARIYWLTRTKKHIDVADIEAAFSASNVDPPGVDPRTWAIVLDVSQAPGVSDTDFEKLVLPHFKHLERFDLCVAIAKSAVGRLGLTRLAREGQVTSTRFSIAEDAAAAVAHVDVERARRAAATNGAHRA